MTSRQPLVAANWKMNGSRESVTALLHGFRQGLPLDGVEVLVCPPCIHIPLAAEELAGSAIGLGGGKRCRNMQTAPTRVRYRRICCRITVADMLSSATRNGAISLPKPMRR